VNFGSVNDGDSYLIEANGDDFDGVRLTGAPRGLGQRRVQLGRRDRATLRAVT